MIYVFLAEGFEETEAIAPIDCLRRAGKTVKIAGVGGTLIRGSHGITVGCDLSADDITLGDDLEMVVLPGGMPGTVNLGNSEVVRKAVTFCYEHDRFLAAICAAPTVFGKMGLLKGRRATCYPGCEGDLTGADYVQAPAVADGNILTGRGPGAALDFGLLLVEKLCSKEAADKLAAGMVCTR